MPVALEEPAALELLEDPRHVLAAPAAEAREVGVGHLGGTTTPSAGSASRSASRAGAAAWRPGPSDRGRAGRRRTPRFAVTWRASARITARAATGLGHQEGDEGVAVHGPRPELSVEGEAVACAGISPRTPSSPTNWGASSVGVEDPGPVGVDRAHLDLPLHEEEHLGGVVALVTEVRPVAVVVTEPDAASSPTRACATPDRNGVAIIASRSAFSGAADLAIGEAYPAWDVCGSPEGSPGARTAALTRRARGGRSGRGGRARPQYIASSTTSARVTSSLRKSSRTYGFVSAWSSHVPRPQKRQAPDGGTAAGPSNPRAPSSVRRQCSVRRSLGGTRVPERPGDDLFEPLAVEAERADRRVRHDGRVAGGVVEQRGLAEVVAGAQACAISSPSRTTSARPERIA